MAFAEAEANTVTDELVARSSLREREQKPEDRITGKGQFTRAIEDSHPHLRRSMKRKTYRLTLFWVQRVAKKEAVSRRKCLKGGSIGDARTPHLC